MNNDVCAIELVVGPMITILENKMHILQTTRTTTVLSFSIIVCISKTVIKTCLPLVHGLMDINTKKIV